MSRPAPSSGEMWKHHKGGIYTIIAIAFIEATGDEVIVYRNVNVNADQRVWVRPTASWMEFVPSADGTMWHPRFERLTET